MTAVETPAHVGLEYDTTCNLDCIHCMQEHRLPRDARIKNLEITEILKREIDNPAVIHIVGGELFASKAFMRLLLEIEPARVARTRLMITTNATLLDARMWDRLGQISDRLRIAALLSMLLFGLAQIGVEAAMA